MLFSLPDRFLFLEMKLPRGKKTLPTRTKRHHQQLMMYCSIRYPVQPILTDVKCPFSIAKRPRGATSIYPPRRTAYSMQKIWPSSHPQLRKRNRDGEVLETRIILIMISWTGAAVATISSTTWRNFYIAYTFWRN